MDNNKENKYYTPEIEEFYVGFEYEVRVEIYWFVRNVLPSWKGLKTLLSNNDIRVKYLDKEDIESLGFKLTYCLAEFPEYEKGETLIGLYKKNTNIYHVKYPGGTLFNGIIKNKSELKKLLSSLEII